MNRGEIRAEVQAQGFDAPSVTRINQWIDAANEEITAEDLWPYRKAYIAGTAPVTTNLLGPIESVYDTANSILLTPRDRVDLLRNGFVLATTGSPGLYWYFNDEAQVDTYPTGQSIEIRLWADAAPLASDSDTPLMPTKYHWLIVQRACSYAAQEIRDWDAYNSYKAEYVMGLDRMRRDLLTQQVQEPVFMAPEA